MSTTVVSAEQKIALGGVTPVLRVSDVPISVDYYKRALGFKVDFLFPDAESPFFASVSRGKCSLFLCAGDQGNPGSWVWIDGKDVETLHEEFCASGAKIRNPPTNYKWAWSCRSKTRMATCYGSAPIQRKISPAARGLICMASGG